jgi:hypothetical protein
MWINSFPCGLSSNEGRRYRLPPNFPVRFHPSDAIEFGSDKKVASLAPLIASPLFFSNNLSYIIWLMIQLMANYHKNAHF